MRIIRGKRGEGAPNLLFTRSFYSLGKRGRKGLRGKSGEKTTAKGKGRGRQDSKKGPEIMGKTFFGPA